MAQTGTSLLSFERGGRVITLAKQEGDTVRPIWRTHLAELDQENLDAMPSLRTRRVSWRHHEASARGAELVAGPRGVRRLTRQKREFEQLAAEVANSRNSTPIDRHRL